MFQFSFEPMGDFTLDDFRRMLAQMAKLGPLDNIMSLIPGMDALTNRMNDGDARPDICRLNGIINSMTAQERLDPSRFIDSSRRRRIADGAGVDPAAITLLLKQFDFLAGLIRRLPRSGLDR